MSTEYGMDNFSSPEEFKIQYTLGTIPIEMLHDVVMDDETPMEVIKFLVSSCKEDDVCEYIVHGWSGHLTDDEIISLLERHPSIDMIENIIRRPSNLKYRSVVDALLKVMLADMSKYNNHIIEMVHAIGDRHTRFHIYRRIVEAAKAWSIYTNQEEVVIGKALTALFFVGEVTLKEE